MTLNYADLFADLGKLIKYSNQFYADAQNIAGYVNAIETEFATDNQEGAIAGLNPAALNSWSAGYTSRRQTLAGYAQARMQDQASVLAFIGAVSTNVSTILPLFITQMVADSETVNRSTTSIGSVTPGASNIGNGTILPTLTLDGFTPSGTRAGINFPAHPLYAGLASELAISETMNVVCSADSYSGNASEGGESFLWTGALADVAYGVDATEGSGSIGTIPAIHANTSRYVKNADFETFAVANTPSNWTITGGIVGTNILKTTAGGNFYHGASGLQLTGDGTTASIGIKQALGAFTPGKAYCCTVRIKASASVAAGTLLINLTGTGYTSSAHISIAFGSLPTAWTLYSFVVVLPANCPPDVALTIAWSGTPTNAKSVFIDDIGFDAVNYGAGSGMIIVRGSTPFVKGDSFSVPLTATEGVVQKFFRQVFGYMLPSTASSPSIADSVAS